MSLLVTGSIAFDSVKTPHGSVTDVLGGSAVYFALAAAHYAPVRLVGVVGEDFPDSFRRVLDHPNIDMAGLEVRRGSKTFRWSGSYDGDMNEARTLDVHLNVLAEDAPRVPAAFADSRFVFLANTHPALQRALLGQVKSAELSVCDTRNLWIENEHDELIKTLAMVHGVIINDEEARMLSGQVNLIRAGEALLKMGPRFAVVKKGEHGALLVTREGVAPIPAYPTREVKDPTGAGDSFAGGLLGYLASVGVVDAMTLRRAVARGAVAASFAIESFSMDRLKAVSRQELDQRTREFTGMLRIE
ncbi:MAG: sugar kinase [Phycisphaerales bacterium]|nr:sugar kinase [Phycisphaerales bacterium]